MNFEPQKFFVGLMDFFSILLPGALLTYLMMGDFGPVILGKRYGQIPSTEAWAVFLAASYLFGHLVFLMGSWLDELYDWIRRYTQNTQIKMLAHRGKLLNWFARAIVAVVFKRERNLAVDRAVKIKEKILDPVKGSSAINTFQWCKALLNVESPTSLAVVQRFEADSKFFRCFVIVLIALAITWAVQQKWQLFFVAVLLLLPLAVWRYMDQRFKATNQAYWSIITLTAKNGNVSLQKAAPPSDALTHAGGVVFRKRWWRVKYLLVEAKDDPNQWVLPKGHIEESENPRETAVREVHEETGVWAKICINLNPVTYTVDGSVIHVQQFLMEALGRGIRQDHHRKHEWLPLEVAVRRANHLETRDLLEEGKVQRELLQAAEQRRSKR